MPKKTANTRRHFLKTSGALLASGGMLSSLGAYSYREITTHAPQVKRKLGIALVGLGRYATWQLAPALRETRNCRLTGIVTGSEDKATLWQKMYGLPPEHIYDYENFDRIAENKAIDIVYVVLPNSMHAEFTIRAARAGKHVICEKPMAVSAGEAQEMIDACKENHVKLSIGYRLHFDPFHRHVMHLGQQEIYGKVMTIEATDSSMIRNKREWRLDSKLSGGGPIMDLGIYTIQGACYTVGDTPMEVFEASYGPNTDPDLYTSIHPSMKFKMRFPNGTISSHETAYNSRGNRLAAVAERGSWWLEPSYGYDGQAGQTPEGPMNFEQVNQQALQMDDFAYCVANDQETLVPGEMGLRDMVIIDAAKKAAETGKGAAVRFDDTEVPYYSQHMVKR